jgi:NAD-dependent dihydropyrimidine dehydrogenase PreA subunit
MKNDVLAVGFAWISVQHQFWIWQVNSRKVAFAAHIEKCWACDTCVGQCPQSAVHVTEKGSVGVADSPDISGQDNASLALLDPHERASYAAMVASLQRVLGLQWK